MDYPMKRGEIYFANLNPTVGSEIAKRRPVLIVSNDINNRAATTITIIPITSKVSRVYPFGVFLALENSGLHKPSKAQP
jgi:mRNA interferase MazF